jgi:hypothetical protein
VLESTPPDNPITHPMDPVSSTVAMTKSPICAQTWLQSIVASLMGFIETTSLNPT